MATIFGIASRSTTATQIPGSGEGPGALWVWGRNGEGQLGLGDNVRRSSPVQLGAATNWSKVAVATGTLAIKTDGTLWSWGANNSGVLGLNDRANRFSPVQVGTGTDWKDVFQDYTVTFATKTNGTLWAWGENGSGNLGLNIDPNVAFLGGARSSPTQVGSDTNWNIINHSGFGTAAIKTDGTLWVWGLAGSGALGLNDTNARSSPTQVGTGSWLDVSLDSNNFSAIRADGTLWSCGSNYSGELGINSRFFDRSSPVQVGSNTNWKNVRSFLLGTLATKTDGTLWTWGGGRTYILNGQGGYGTVSSPTQVGTDTNWSFNNVKLSSSTNPPSISILKTNGTLWMSGDNSYGQLGLNNTANRSSPVQIGTDTNWSCISSSLMGAGIKRI